jgi:uncharacterized protein YjiS (DUF1127 family)
LADRKCLAKPAHRPIPAGTHKTSEPGRGARDGHGRQPTFALTLTLNKDSRTIYPRYPPARKKTMFYDTSASHRPPRPSFLTIAFRPWQMLADLMAERSDYARLSSLDDHMLKDLGLTRGSIRSAIRDGRTHL